MSKEIDFRVNLTMTAGAWWGRGSIRRSIAVLYLLFRTAIDVFINGVELPTEDDDEGS